MKQNCRFKSLLVCILSLVLVCVQSTSAVAQGGTSISPLEGGVTYGSMAFQVMDQNFKVHGWCNQWLQSTSGIFHIYQKNQNGMIESLPSTFQSVDSDGNNIKDKIEGTLNNGVSLTITAEAVENDDTALKICYTVKNDTGVEQTFGLGTVADVKDVFYPNKTLSLLDNNAGINITFNTATDGVYPQFRFFGRNHEGVTDVTDFWYGTYGTSAYRADAAFYKHDDHTEQDETVSMSWHWDNITLDTTDSTKEKTFSVLFSISESSNSGSEDDSGSNGNGTTPNPNPGGPDDPIVPCNPNDPAIPSDPTIPTVPVILPTVPNLPKTGDSTPLALCMTLLFGSALVLLRTQRKIKKSH